MTGPGVWELSYSNLSSEISAITTTLGVGVGGFGFLLAFSFSGPW